MAESKEKSISSYNYGVVSSPMAGVKQEYDVCIGEFLRRAAFWRYSTVILLLVALILVLCLIMSVSGKTSSVTFLGVNANGSEVLINGKLEYAASFPENAKISQIMPLVQKKLGVDHIILSTTSGMVR